MKAGLFCIIFLFLFSLSLFAQEESNFQRTIPTPNHLQSNSPCNCLIPIDSTFTIVHFDYMGSSGGPGIPPEYRNDDWCSAPLPLPFIFCFYGQSVDSIFINNNGCITVDSHYAVFFPSTIPDPTYKMIAPNWADVDTRAPLSGIVYYKITPSSLIVIWDHVGYFSVHDDKLNTFQLIMTDGVDPIIPNGNTSFCYGDMQWTTGDASQGINGFGGQPSVAGVNFGDGMNYIQFGLFDQPGYVYDGPYLLNDGVDWLDGKEFNFNLCPLNVPPVALDCMNDTLVMHVSDTAFLDFYFLSPEINQNATITLQPGTLNGFSVLSNDTGEYVHVQAQLIADIGNLGFNTIAVSATDAGSPPGNTSYSKVVQILPFTGIDNIENPEITIFPNPLTEESILTIKGFPYKDLIFTLYDISGRIILSKELNSNSIILSKDDVSKGIYICNLSSKSGFNYSGKLVIE